MDRRGHNTADTQEAKLAGLSLSQMLYFPKFSSPHTLSSGD